MPRTRATLLGLVSYVVATLIAAAAVLLLLGTPPADFVDFYPGAAMIVLVFALVPFALAIAILHAIKRTGWLAHAAAGLVVSLAAQFIMSPGMLGQPGALMDGWPIPVAGALAGLVYWLVNRALSRRVT
jgi:hypothetical protein